MNFESELKKGNFMVTECNNCQKIVWPSSEYCNFCFKETRWRASSGIGKILEFSKKDETFFCLVELENAIKIIGQISFENPKVGDKVCIDECGIINNNMFIKFRILK